MKKITINSLVWSIILLLNAYCFFRMIFSGDINNFIHPKMIKYTYLGAFVILIMGIYQLIAAEDDGDRGTLGYILFLVPVLIYLLVKPSGLGESVAINRGINMKFYQERVIVNNDNHNHQHTHGDDKMIVLGNNIIINSDNYYNTIKNVYGNTDEYKDKILNLKGFVVKEKGKQKGFILARMVVSCCAADTEVIGVYCDYDNIADLKGGEWVEVQGRVTKAKDGSSIPGIYVQNLKVIDEPVNKYIYRD